MLKSGTDPVIVVAVSSTVLESETDRVALPNKQDTPQTRSGLPRACWAVPRWFPPIERAKLTDRAGHIGGRVLRDLLAAVEARMTADGSGNVT